MKTLTKAQAIEAIQEQYQRFTDDETTTSGKFLEFTRSGWTLSNEQPKGAFITVSEDFWMDFDWQELDDQVDALITSIKSQPGLLIEILKAGF